MGSRVGPEILLCHGVQDSVDATSSTAWNVSQPGAIGVVCWKFGRYLCIYRSKQPWFRRLVVGVLPSTRVSTYRRSFGIDILAFASQNSKCSPVDHEEHTETWFALEHYEARVGAAFLLLRR